MDIFSIFKLLGGLAFFLFGMNVMSTSLEKMAGGKLEKMLKQLTSNPIKSLLFGAGITIAIQSSSALTVMLVGLVNSGIMDLSQTVGVLMGSNVGTTLTAWILSLSGIESNSFFLSLLKPANFAPLAAFIGILLTMISKKESKHDTGKMLIGFSVLMTGMTMMSDSCAPLAEIPEFAQILTMFNNPLLGVIVGAIFTGMIQSSAASVGILQALSQTGALSFRMSIPIIMGQNIGTCVTALISSIGVNRNAKRVSVVHIAFNLIGTIIGLAVFYGLDLFIHFPFMDTAISPFMIAICHSIFNIATTIILLPFTKQLVQIAMFVIKDDNKKEEYAFLDERLIKTPRIALEECLNLTKKMVRIAQDSVEQSILLINKYDEKIAQRINENETQLDLFEDKLDTYLVHLSKQEIVESDSKEIFKLLHSIGDIERLGDHACNILDFSKTMHEKEITFSEDAMSELSVLSSAVKEVVEIMAQSFEKNDLSLAVEVEPLEEVIDLIVSKMKKSHIKRLQKGVCTVDHGYLLNDMINNFERMSDHCSNIALSVIEAKLGDNFDTHEYISNLRSSNTPEFKEFYQHYKEKYKL
ncbi:MAG: Na/Pi cotransporter family protein [Traorella sp.]